MNNDKKSKQETPAPEREESDTTATGLVVRSPRRTEFFANLKKIAKSKGN